MNNRAAQLYKSTSANSAVAAASPHKQVALLLDCCRKRIATAIACIEAGDRLGKVTAIQKATDIVAQLSGTLDHVQGGEVAASLEQLYDYVMRQLGNGNAKNDPALLRDADKIVAKIEDGWNAIASQAAA